MTKHLLPTSYTLAAADVAELTRTERRADGIRVTRGACLSRAAPHTAAHQVRTALLVLPETAAALPPEELVAVGDSLFRHGHLDAASLDERLDRARGTRGVTQARALAPLLTALAASRPESLTRF